MRKVLGAVLILLLVGSVTGCRWRPPAATVNGTEISNDDLQSEVELMIDNPEVASLFLPGAAASDLSLATGTIPATVTAAVLTNRIREVIFAEEYANSPKKLSAEEEVVRQSDMSDRLVQALGSQSRVDALPLEFRNRIVLREVRGAALFGDLAPEEQQAAVVNAMSRATVTVDASYGTWDETSFVVTPNPAPGFAPAADQPEP